MRFHVKAYRDGNQWTAEVVDAPGVATCGPTREDVLIGIVDALSGWLESYAATGETPPRVEVDTHGLVEIDLPEPSSVD